jgi:hypothetical protein
VTQDELRARQADAWIVLQKVKDRGGLTMFEASAKLMAEFVRDLSLPEKKD